MSASRTTLLPGFIVFVFIIVGILTWSASLANKRVQPSVHRDANAGVCSQDVQVCPDGSSVGRQPPSCSFAPCSTTSWKTYQDPESRFSFEYPSTWTLVTVQSNSMHNQALIYLKNPDDVGVISANSDGSGIHVALSLFADMNTDAARGGSWEGMRTYTSLVDFLSDRSALKRNVGQVILGGQTGYSVSVVGEGTNYGVMAQRTEGIYELDFPTRWSTTQLSELDQHLIDSWRFGPLPTPAR